MPKVTYLVADGERSTFDLRLGQSVMEGATRNGVRGILAECGGASMCATCHVYVESEGIVLPPVSAEEDAMLDESAAERRPSSRLSCQLRMTEAMDGLVVRVADNH